MLKSLMIKAISKRRRRKIKMVRKFRNMRTMLNLQKPIKKLNNWTTLKSCFIPQS